MRVYLVGGSVRDELLGLPVKDRDWVVVGSTSQEMERLGYKPVGRDFPVFLHPQTREEHALARTERKVGPGYKGFVVHADPQVTLEQDLERRDLTINAIARDPQDGLIDPFGGQKDLRAGVLRHVSPAFAEDPVRILRVARFAARFGFAVAPETLALMRAMVADGEADALVAERVWQEFARGLMEKNPWRMLAILSQSGLLARWLPELGLAIEDERAADEASAIVAQALGYAASHAHSLPVRFALLLHGARGRPDDSPSTALESVCVKLRVPSDCRDLAVLAERKIDAALNADRFGPEALMTLLEASDAFRRPQRLDELMNAAEAEGFGAGRPADEAARRAEIVRLALEAAQSVDAGALARQHAASDIGPRVRQARIERITAALERRRTSS